MKFLAILFALLVVLSSFVAADCYSDPEDYDECLAQQSGSDCAFFQNAAYCDKKFDCPLHLAACQSFQAANPSCGLDCNSAFSTAPTLLFVAAASLFTLFLARR